MPARLSTYEFLETLSRLLKKCRQVNGRTDTLLRLKEAAFFLSKMEETYIKSDDFSHYMTAFVVLARSVLWIMNSEFNNVPGYKAWYSSQKATDREERLFKKITELRNRLMKSEPLKLRMKGEITFNPKDISFIEDIEHMTVEEMARALDEIFEGKKLVLTLEDEAKENGDRNFIPLETVELVGVEHDLLSDILKECREYLLILAQICLSAISQFEIKQKWTSL